MIKKIKINPTLYTINNNRIKLLNRSRLARPHRRLHQRPQLAAHNTEKRTAPPHRYLQNRTAKTRRTQFDHRQPGSRLLIAPAIAGRRLRRHPAATDRQ